MAADTITPAPAREATAGVALAVRLVADRHGRGDRLGEATAGVAPTLRPPPWSLATRAALAGAAVWP